MALQAEQQIHEALKRHERILIAIRKDWSIDGIASALALQRILVKKGKKAEIVCDGFSPAKSISFLPGVEVIKKDLAGLRQFVISLDLTKTKIDELSYDVVGDKLRIAITPKTGSFVEKDVSASPAEYSYDLIITVDAPDYASLGAVFSNHTDFFYHRPVINLDNDPANEQFGNINAVDIAATSCAEVLHRLMDGTKEHFLDADTATCILAGMIAETKSFKTLAVTPKSLELASALVAAGGRRDEIVQNLYRTRSLATLKLWGRALARLRHDPATKIAWSVLLRQDFIHAGAGEEYLSDVIDELIANAPEAEIIALLYEQESTTVPGKIENICGLVSSEKHANALGLVESLRPEGTRKLARLCFPNTAIAEAEKTVLGAIAKSLGKTTQLPVSVILNRPEIEKEPERLLQ